MKFLIVVDRADGKNIMVREDLIDVVYQLNDDTTGEEYCQIDGCFG